MRVQAILVAVGGWVLFAQQPPLKTIQEIQTPVDLAAGNDTSVLHGQRVRVRGVVVTECSWHQHYGVSGGPNSKRCSIWLQAQGQSGPRTGLQIRRQNTTDVPPGFTSLAQGQLVEITGYVDYFRGEIQLRVDTTVAPVILAPGQPIAPPAPLSVSDLNFSSGSHNLQSGDQWQGSFVKLTNLTVTSVATNPLRITATDASGYQIVIFGEFKGLTGSYPVGTKLDSVKGIVLHYWPSTGTPMYEICPWHDSLMYVGDPVPYVRNLSRTPVCPRSSDAVQVSVEASSSSSSDPVTGVTLYWSTGSSTTYTAVLMTASGSTYTATLPAQPEGTYVHYYVVAQDQSGDQVKFPRFEPQSYRVNNAGCRIPDIQYVIPSVLYAYNPNARRDYLGSGYARLAVTNVPGVVTASENDLGYIHIQQPGVPDWAGIWVVASSSMPALQIGDTVVVTNATVEEYFGLTRLNNAQITRVGAASAPIEPVVLPLSVVYGDTQYAATEPYESMLVRFRHDNPSQVLHVVQPKVSTQTQHAGDYRVGMDPADPLRGIRVLAGRQTSNIFSSLRVSYINDSLWATVDGVILASPLCVVGDTTQMDSLQGILTYQWNFVKLLPRTNQDFYRVLHASCADTTSGGGGGAALIGASSLPLVYGPNPTRGEVAMYLPAEYGQAQFRLYSLEGRLLQEGAFWGQGKVDLGAFPRGVYLLTIEARGSVARVRVVRL
uniref:T9SS type A sorting domain-containing protein n=1 Tax=uncultured Bacteroidota bacterium TaxID=152509 RepID=H5SK35_9BACT|nr:hypothetical protein HGMM_F40B03C09 [uncultured Bacteroidetes bacterium]